jgi:hypothetical protein
VNCVIESLESDRSGNEIFVLVGPSLQFMLC